MITVLASTSTSASISTTTDGTSIELQPTDEISSEEQKCREFIQRTCSCRLNNRSPRSRLVPLQKYVCHRSEAAALTRDQLDLVLIGAVMSLVNTDDQAFDHSHKSKTRQRIYSQYLFGGQHVCRNTFQLLYRDIFTRFVEAKTLQLIPIIFPLKINSTGK